jgi:pyruvate/2-oxoglutarate dehydrogenase complex dihydrolipoamide dehydrogenase (E3) component
MTRDIKADLCIIGAGSGGLSVAAGAQDSGTEGAGGG